MPISKGPNCFGDVMGEFKRGELSSGKNGPTVKSRKQAKAIASSMCHTEDAEPEHGCCPHSEDPEMDKRKAQMKAYGFSEEAIDRFLEEADAKYGEKKGLWDNIHAKRKRGERMRKPGEKGAPSDQDLKDAQSKD